MFHVSKTYIPIAETPNFHDFRSGMTWDRVYRSQESILQWRLEGGSSKRVAFQFLGWAAGLMDFNGDLMGFYGDLMGVYGELMGFYGDLWWF